MNYFLLFTFINVPFLINTLFKLYSYFQCINSSIYKHKGCRVDK